MAETVANIEADLVVLRAARTKLASGEMVREVARDGRKLVKGIPTLTELTLLIERRERDLEAAQAVADGYSRRRAIPLGWGN